MSGNNAAMREALEKASVFLHRHNMGAVGMPDGSVLPCWELAKIVDAALAKPPRNCDRFGGDYKKLHAEWFEWTGTPSGQNPDGTAKMAFGEWLLAPAIKKGGAK